MVTTDTAHAALSEQLLILAPDQIDPDPTQPRKYFDQEELDHLAASMARLGQLEVILVRPHPDHPDRYLLVAGERRWRAAQVHSGMSLVARIHPDRDVLLVQAAENLARHALSPPEMLDIVIRLMALGFDAKQTANTIGMSHRTWSRYHHIAQDPEAAAALRAGVSLRQVMQGVEGQPAPDEDLDGSESKPDRKPITRQEQEALDEADYAGATLEQGEVAPKITELETVAPPLADDGRTQLPPRPPIHQARNFAQNLAQLWPQLDMTDRDEIRVQLTELLGL